MKGSVECKIEYNNAVEFVCSILKYTNNITRQVHWNTPDLEKDVAKDIMDFSPNEKVKEWLKYVDDNISPFLRNDIMFVASETYRLPDICFHLILMQDIKEPLELIEAIKSLDLSIMIKIAYKFYDLKAPLDNEEILRASLIENYSNEISTSFLHFKNHTQEYKDRMIEVLLSFYKGFYQYLEETVYNYMKQRLVFYNDLFEKDPIYFINTVGIGDYSKAIEMHNHIILYMSFFIDMGILYFTFEDTLVMYCGQTIEHKFESRKKHDSYKALFKALSDDKRLEILKLTSIRPWYNKELADHFKLTTATLSYHLNLLLDFEILNFEPSIINNRYYYTTNKENLKKLFDAALEDLLE